MQEVDLDPYEESMPAAWDELIESMRADGSDASLVEAAKSRLQVAVTAHQIAHERRTADMLRQHERALETRREAHQNRMAARAETFQQQLDARANTRHTELMRSATLDRAAQKTASDAAARAARALNVATWVLAGATVILVFVTATHGA